MRNKKGFVSAALVLGLALAAVIVITICGIAFGIVWRISDSVSSSEQRAAAESNVGSAAVADEDGEAVLSGQFKSVRAERFAGTLEFRTGDSYSAEISGSRGETAEISDGTLVITQPDDFWTSVKSVFGVTDCRITVTVPENVVLENVYIKGFAGKADLSGFRTESLTLECGAGDVSVTDVASYGNSKITGGAGRLTLENCALNNADISIGVGQTTFSGVVGGSTKVSCGVGAFDMRVKADKSNYTVGIKTGLGPVTVDGTSVSGISSSGNGPYRIDLSCGIGSVKLSFGK